VYDFIGGLLQTLGATPSRVVLDDVNGEGSGGTVFVHVAAGEIGVPCYAPDAIGLALRANVPIFASPGALDHGKPARGPDAAGDVVGWLERLRPEDFD
jgi:bifunctional DNase/RNase